MTTRRDFIRFMGRAGFVAATVAPLANALGQNAFEIMDDQTVMGLPFYPLKATTQDNVVLADGFSYDVVIKWGDKIANNLTFGFNNDYLAFFPLNGSKTDGILWVNHESTDPYFVSKAKGKEDKTKEQVDLEMQSVGGSLVRIKLNPKSKKWEYVPNDTYNRRLTALTPIPFANNVKIAGFTEGIGTLGNCAGGVTPWGTLLTCEENYDDFWGDLDLDGKPTKVGSLQWEKYYSHNPWHYGWVVEVDPKTGKAKKHTSMGRFAHEAANASLAPDGRCVVYTGDDCADQCLYKFISDEPNNLEKGKLYVANFEKGAWIPLDFNTNPQLQEKFKTELDMLIHCRIAADLVGGSKLDRPEDIEIDPITGDVFVTLTNNTGKENYFGSIVRIKEASRDALTFTHETVVTGGSKGGFACPDNIAFDKMGNLWFTSDISGRTMRDDPRYKEYGNNGLFYVPMKGENAGQAFRVASAPIGAEFTGPYFSPDGETLFLSVQHPGETSSSENKYTSLWPYGEIDKEATKPVNPDEVFMSDPNPNPNATKRKMNKDGSLLDNEKEERMPRPAVIAISGPSLTALVNNK